MKVKVLTPLDESVDITLDEGAEYGVAALRAKFEQLNLPTDDYVFRRKGKKTLDFENGAEFELVHKDDVVDQKEFDTVLNAAAEGQVELGKEVDAMLGLDAGGDSGSDDSVAIASKESEKFEAMHAALAALLTSPSDDAVDTFFKSDRDFWSKRRQCKSLKEDVLFDAMCALVAEVCESCQDNGVTTTKLFWPAGEQKKASVVSRLFEKISDIVRNSDDEEGFHTADRHRRYFATLVKSMKVRTVKGKDLPDKPVTTDRAYPANADHEASNMSLMIKTVEDLDLLRRMVAQVSRLDMTDGEKPDKGTEFNEKTIYMTPYDRPKRFLYKVAHNINFRDFKFDSLKVIYDVLVRVFRISAFMEPDTAEKFLDNAHTFHLFRLDKLANATDDNPEETAEKIMDVYSKSLQLAGGANGSPIQESIIGNRLNLNQRIKSPEVAGAFLKKIPDLLARVVEYPRLKGDYPQYVDRLMGDASKKSGNRDEYVKKYAGARQMALERIIVRLQIMSADIRAKNGETMIEIIGGLLKACFVGPADLGCIKVVMEAVYGFVRAVNVGKVARKHLLITKNKDVILRLFKHLTALYSNVPEKIPGFPEWRKDYLIGPMNMYLMAFGQLIVKHPKTMGDAVGVLLGYVIRLGAAENSGFVAGYMQGYVQSNPEKLAPYVQVIMNGLKQEGQDRALGALPLLQHLQFQHCGRALSDNVEVFIDIVDSDEFNGPMGASYTYPLYSIFAKIAEFNPKALDDHIEDLIEICLADTSNMRLTELVNALKSYAAYNPEPFAEKLDELAPMLMNQMFISNVPFIFASVAKLSEEKAQICIEKLGTAAATHKEMFSFSFIQAMIIAAKDNPELLKPHAAWFEKLEMNPQVQAMAKQAIDFMNGTEVDEQIKALFKAQDELKERVENVEEEMKEVKQDVSVLTAEMTEVRDTLDVHSAQIAKVGKDVDDNKQAIANASGNVDISEIEFRVAEAVRDDILALSLRVDQQDDALESLDTMVTETKEDLGQAKAEMQLNFDQLQSNLDKRMGEFQKQLDEAAKNLPIPCNFTHEKVHKGIKVALVLHFKCNKQVKGICQFVDEKGEETTFKSKTTFVNKWLKVGVAAVQVGVAVATQNAGKALKGLHQMWKSANIEYDVGFDAFVNQPFLLSEEQDALIKQLRKVKFFDAFANVEQQWICVACAKEDARAKKKEERRRDFELQVQRLEQAKAKNAKKSKKDKAKEMVKKLASNDAVQDKVKDAILGGDDEDGEEDDNGEGGEEKETGEAGSDVAKEAIQLEKMQKQVDDDEEEEAAVKSGVGAINDEQGEDSSGGGGDLAAAATSSKSGDDDKDDDGEEGLCADCCVIL